LKGHAPGEALWKSASERASDGAKPLPGNRFKVDLVKRTVERQLAAVAAMT
jgi:xanthine dehydrogenase YagS FAD-binding subunit